jgi:hypothetical protein
MGIFSVASVLIVRQEALDLEGELHRFLTGLLLASLAWLGLSASRALAGAPGIAARIRLPLRALSASVAVAFTLFFADQSRPIEHADLVRFTVSDAGALVGKRLVHLEKNEVLVEYVELDHTATGWHYVIPMAITGKESEPLHVNAIDRWIADVVLAHVDTFQSRGLLVHSRIDKRQVAPGETYEIADIAGQVTIRRVGQ